MHPPASSGTHLRASARGIMALQQPPDACQERVVLSQQDLHPGFVRGVTANITESS